MTIEVDQRKDTYRLDYFVIKKYSSFFVRQKSLYKITECTIHISNLPSIFPIVNSTKHCVYNIRNICKRIFTIRLFYI